MSAHSPYIVPSVAAQNTLTDDFLLISVIPNCVTKKSYKNNDKIIIFGGTHGVGTLSIDPLFRDSEILESLKKKTKNMKHWQALIKVTEIGIGIGIHKTHGRSFPFCISNNIDVRSLTPIPKYIEIFPANRSKNT